MLNISPIPAFSDNYIWLMQNAEGACAVVDPGDAQPVIATLQQYSLKLDAILITHHHFDHTGGIKELSDAYSCPVYGPDLEDNSTLSVHALQSKFKIITVPGHTLDHIAFYSEPYLFCGDTLFSAGCGRLFEGSPEQMYNSLNKLKSLPDDTLVFCAHEYTLSNIKFALSVEPNNATLKRYELAVQSLRDNNQVSLPSKLGLEKQINPFLRCDSPEIISSAEKLANKTLNDPVQVFATIRNAKDHF